MSLLVSIASSAIKSLVTGADTDSGTTFFTFSATFGYKFSGTGSAISTSATSPDVESSESSSVAGRADDFVLMEVGNRLLISSLNSGSGNFGGSYCS